MKRTLIVMAAAVFVVGMAYAGDYHYGTSLRCTDCHTMHAQQSHAYSNDTYAFQSWGPTHFLLKGDSVSDMCLGCHNDNNGYPDVMRADNGALPASGRSAGALNQAGLLEGYDSYMGHTIGSTRAAPGLTGSFVPSADGLGCTDCHIQHGRNLTGHVFNPAESVNPYRNLAVRGGVTISYNRNTDNTFSSTNNLNRDVFEDGSNNYEQDGNFLNEPVITDSGYGTWCTGCHVGFHGDVGGSEIGGVAAAGAGYEEFIRHPNSTVNIGEVRTSPTGTSSGGHSSIGTFLGTLYRVRVMSPDNEWPANNTTYPATQAEFQDLTPTCLSCHKAHGTTRPFGLIYALGNAALGENGDGTQQKHLCRQCHVQGAD